MAKELDLEKLAERKKLEQETFQKVDGRSRRRGTRHTPVSFRVSPEKRAQLHRLAEAQDMTYVELFEASLDIYERYLRGEL